MKQSYLSPSNQLIDVVIFEDLSVGIVDNWCWIQSNENDIIGAKWS